MIVPTLLLGALLGATPAFEPRPCPAAEAADTTVTCGVVKVPEDRRQPRGRQIELHVMVLAAATNTPALPPLLDIDGGPGFAATRSATFYRTDGLAYRAQRAVILVDQRGTGASHPLRCPEFETRAAQLAPLYPVEVVARCRDELEAQADLTQYTTTTAAADLDAVRAALGYERVDIVAISYGTTLSLRYLADFPGRVRAAALMSVVPASARPPQHHASVAEGALTQNFADCRADGACRAAFPDLDGDLRAALAKLADPSAAMLPEVFLEKVRTLLNSPGTARGVPLVVHAAGQGDLAPLLAAIGPGPGAGFADGAYLSITCAESLALMDFAAATRESQATRFGDYRLRQQRAACAAWPTAKVSHRFLEPLHAETPVLLISGARDPVTPAAWASEAARTLPNSRHVVIPWSGHSFDGLSNIDTCYDAMLLQFFATGDAKRLDTACVDQMLPPPFATRPR